MIVNIRRYASKINQPIISLFRQRIIDKFKPANCLTRINTTKLNYYAYRP
jgi:hypothetical protein